MKIDINKILSDLISFSTNKNPSLLRNDITRYKFILIAMGYFTCMLDTNLISKEKYQYIIYKLSIFLNYKQKEINNG